jgi:hypothetical protein
MPIHPGIPETRVRLANGPELMAGQSVTVTADDAGRPQQDALVTLVNGRAVALRCDPVGLDGREWTAYTAQRGPRGWEYVEAL